MDPFRLWMIFVMLIMVGLVVVSTYGYQKQKKQNSDRK
jgi:hypothetical protein